MKHDLNIFAKQKIKNLYFALLYYITLYVHAEFNNYSDHCRSLHYKHGHLVFSTLHRFRCSTIRKIISIYNEIFNNETFSKRRASAVHRVSCAARVTVMDVLNLNSIIIWNRCVRKTWAYFILILFYVKNTI